MNSANKEQLKGVTNSTKDVVTRNGLNAEVQNNMKFLVTMIV